MEKSLFITSIQQNKIRGQSGNLTGSNVYCTVASMKRDCLCDKARSGFIYIESRWVTLLFPAMWGKTSQEHSETDIYVVFLRANKHIKTHRELRSNLQNGGGTQIRLKELKVKVIVYQIVYTHLQKKHNCLFRETKPSAQTAWQDISLCRDTWFCHWSLT